MDRLKPAYYLAAAADPSLTTQLAGLTTLLGAQKVIARKGATTRLLNKKAIAEGKAPTHGKVGKVRKRSAERAALAQATPPPTPTEPSVPAPAVTVAAPSGELAPQSPPLVPSK